MEMNERLKLTNGKSETLLAWSGLRIRTGSEEDGDLVEQEDTTTFTVHNTRRNRKFLYADIARMTAEATRSMPGRKKLDVVSVRPTPDRSYLLIECKG